MFWIRADGNKSIGMGHIMRCLTIAEALHNRGESVCFVVANEEPVELIKRKGFDVKVLCTDYRKPEEELLRFQAFREKEKEKILVDTYFASSAYLQELRKWGKVFLMDDMGETMRPCDTLVNYNIYAEEPGYESMYPDGTELLLGTRYIPLRSEFTGKEKKQIKETVENILVTTGGGDPLGFLEHFVDYAPSEFHYFLVCGPFYTDTEKLETALVGRTNFKIYKNVTDMSKLMQAADLAVSAAGSTFYELSAMGVPFVGYYYAENQRRNMEAFHTKLCICNAGDFSVTPDETLGKIVREIGRLSGNQSAREAMSSSLQSCVDGEGAGRLANFFSV